MTTKSYDVLCDLSLANGIRERGAMNCDPNLILTLTLILLLTLQPSQPGQGQKEQLESLADNEWGRLLETVHHEASSSAFIQRLKAKAEERRRKGHLWTLATVVCFDPYHNPKP